jgi:hypothetical protein
MIQTQIERITPKLAEAYLESNTANRKARSAHVARLANDMAKGRWLMNGAAIVFNGDGSLLDGQHRLMAIVDSGLAMEMLVVRGVSRLAMPTIDANVPRTAADAMALNNIKHSNRLSAAIRFLMGLRDGSASGNIKRSNSEIIEFLAKHSALSDITTETDAACKLLRSAYVIPWFYLATRLTSPGVVPHDRTAQVALETMVSGVPVYAGDPIHVFRERIIRFELAMRTPADRMAVLWTLIAAWNDFVVGEKSKICKIRRAPVQMIGVKYSDL